MLLAGSTVFAQGDEPSERPSRADRIKEFDKDGDGELNEEERTAMREAAQARMLEQYDKDGDGELSDEERAAMREQFRGRRGGGERGTRGGERGNRPGREE